MKTTRKIYLGRRHQNVIVNDAILVLDTAASVAIRCIGPAIAVGVAIVGAPVLIAWSVLNGRREREREREERFEDGGEA